MAAALFSCMQGTHSSRKKPRQFQKFRQPLQRCNIPWVEPFGKYLCYCSLVCASILSLCARQFWLPGCSRVLASPSDFCQLCSRHYLVMAVVLSRVIYWIFVSRMHLNLLLLLLHVKLVSWISRNWATKSALNLATGSHHAQIDWQTKSSYTNWSLIGTPADTNCTRQTWRAVVTNMKHWNVHKHKLSLIGCLYKLNTKSTAAMELDNDALNT